MNIILLFVVTVLIWGSTWLAITFQLEKVDPLVSVFYRFTLASIILFVYCKIKQLKLRFSLHEHLFMALQGLLLFTFAYWLVYLAEMHLTSGLVAVITSLLIFLNIINGSYILGNRIGSSVVIGAVLGLTGIVFIFWKEISSFSFSDKNFYALVLTLVSTIIYSFGNITSARNQAHGLPVMQTNAFSMGYASIILLTGILVMNKPVHFDVSLMYIASLLYLSLFGSVIAFGCYLTLIGAIGPEKAAYGPLVVPVIALGLSSIFEGYRWSLFAFLGLLLILIGNFFILKKST